MYSWNVIWHENDTTTLGTSGSLPPSNLPLRGCRSADAAPPAIPRCVVFVLLGSPTARPSDTGGVVGAIQWSHTMSHLQECNHRGRSVHCRRECVKKNKSECFLLHKSIYAILAPRWASLGRRRLHILRVPSTL
jgi:hypothetical protein